MPKYVFECPICGTTKEMEIRLTELSTYTLYCSECDDQPMKRIIALVAFGNASEVAKKREGR